MEAHRATNPDPMEVKAGDRVRVGREDPENPGWKWCTAQDGKESWVPVALLQQNGDSAVLLESYLARELDVEQGAEVTVHRELEGWLWVTDAQGRTGWIPAR